MSDLAAPAAQPKRSGTAKEPRPRKDVATIDSSDVTGPPQPPPAPPTYGASVHTPDGAPLAPEFVDAIRGLEDAIERPVWFLVQINSPRPMWGMLSDHVRGGFTASRADLREGGRIALVIDSPGGYAQAAYQIARMLQRHCGGFTAVVPRYAKSAATLLCLGADEIIMGEDAELGPLDAQLWDNEREEHGSALDEVQALDQLYSVALQQVDEMMSLLLVRTPKRTETLLPIACKFSADMMAPLLDKVDAVHYGKQARILKVAEDYAFRLLLRGHPPERAKIIADRLVTGYPEHGFVIDRDEACELRLNVIEADEGVAGAVQKLDALFSEKSFVAHGRLEMRTTNEEDSESQHVE